MHRFIPMLLGICGLVGCNDQMVQTDIPSDIAEVQVPGLPTEVAKFAEHWNAASAIERQGLADSFKVSQVFLGVTKEHVEEVFGEADQAGVDTVGEDVLRYELGEIAESNGDMAHLKFVFKNDAVTNVDGSAMSDGP